MDHNDIRAVITVASFAAFVGIVWWAYGARRKRAFEEAARSILDERSEAQGASRGEGR
jgi:cytochrome c oxidase cbb3-type subunit 4